MAQLEKKYKILFIIALLVIGLDQLTKYLVLQHFSLGQSWPILSDYFNLTYVQNRGAAFGFMARADAAIRVPFFIVVPLFALGTIGYVFRKVPASDWRMTIALSLVMSGAVGNLIDRIHLGFVVDFLDFHWRWKHHFPAFNVADSAICVGVGIVMLDILTQTPPETETKG